MLRIIETGNALPISYPVSPDAIFQSGSVATLTVLGSQIVAAPSVGVSFLGIFDDVKTNSFSQISWDERVIITPLANNIMLNGSNQLVIKADVKTELANPNIDGNSFVSNPVPVELIPRNGVVVFLAGTVLNMDIDGDGTPDSISTLVRYSYMIPNVPGDNSVAASGQATIWFQKMIFQTDQFEPNVSYQVMCNLFVNATGLFTTRQIYPNSPIIAICTSPPSALNSTLEAMLL